MDKTISFANLEIQIKESGLDVVYCFKGDVDENFRQQDVPRLSKANIIFDLDQIQNFNSCGIREWIYLVKDFSKLGKLLFRGCSVTMVDQINMVPDSLGEAQIESFYAPYFCATHGEVNIKILVSEAKEMLAQKQAPEFACPQCSKSLEFDALEESYFLFADSNDFKKVS